MDRLTELRANGENGVNKSWDTLTTARLGHATASLHSPHRGSVEELSYPHRQGGGWGSGDGTRSYLSD